MAGTIERVRGAEEFVLSTTGRSRLSNVLLQVIREGRVRLFDDPDLRAELLSLVIVEKSYGWRSDHPVGGHDDRTCALGLALIAAENLVTHHEPDLFVGSF